MSSIPNYFKKQKKNREYKASIDEHKKNILKAFYEMFECIDLEWIMKDPKIYNNLWTRALEHDDSKYEKAEFQPYRKHYFPIDKEEQITSGSEYLKAVEHHYANNDHHWQNRINWKDEDFNINTELACLENVMDWLAVGYKFGNRPYQYYDLHKEEITLPKKQKDFIEKCIYEGIDKKYILKERGICDENDIIF